MFFVGKMDLGMREIGQPADVIHVAVSYDGVRDILTSEPQPLDLANGCFGLVEDDAERVDQLLSDSFDRVFHFSEAESGVHEREAILVFE